MFSQQIQRLPFRLEAGRRLNRNVKERDPVELGQHPAIFVVAENQRNRTIELACALALQEVAEAVEMLRNEDRDLRNSV